MYAGTVFTARLSGSTAVAVRCENCRVKYYYPLHRTAVASETAHYGVGLDTARSRARKRVHELLRHMLEERIEAVPCPRCGCYQEKMFPLLRAPRYRWMQDIGILGMLFSFFAAIALLLLIFAPGLRPLVNINSEVAVGLFVCIGTAFLLSLGLLLMRGRRQAAYDPNDPETELERIALSRKLSITKEQAEAIMQDQ
jgi:hypothetical protein